MVVAALFVRLSACARPQGTIVATPTLLPSATPVATPALLPSATPVAAHGPLTVATPIFHAGEVGVTYSPVTLQATGGATPYRWTVSVGALPAGMSLSTDGVVSGKPAAYGHYRLSVQVFDADGETAGLPAIIPIVPRLTASLVPACATECAVEIGGVSVCGRFGELSGGVAPFSYSLRDGVLPVGTTLAGLSLKGTFKGPSGRVAFTVRVTDGFGASTTISPTFLLFAHISFSGSYTCSGAFANSCSVTMPYSGGTPGGSPAVRVTGYAAYCTTGTFLSCYPPPLIPPPTFSASATASGPSASGGSVTVTVQAVCGGSCPNGWYGTLYLSLTDRNLCSAGTYCSTSAVRVDITMAAG